MRKAGQILQRILALVGALKLPSDLKELWGYVRNHLYQLMWPAGAAVVVALAGWWRDAPFWQVVVAIFLVTVLVYLVVFGLGTLRQRGVFDRRTSRLEPPQPADAPEEGLTAQENRELLYEALVDRSQDGLVLLEDPDFYEADVIEKWERRTSKVITAALGQDEGMTFLIDDDISVKGWFTTPLERRVARRMHRLEQLMERVDSSEPLELQSDFDGREWVSKR